MLEGLHAELRDALARRDRERLIEVLEGHVAIFRRRIAWTVQQPSKLARETALAVTCETSAVAIIIS